MKANRQRLENFVALLREGLNPSEAARRLGYARGPSSWANGSKLLRQAKEMGWCDAQGKPRPIPKPKAAESVRLKLPPDERRELQRIDSETLRRKRLAEFLAVPLNDIQELQKVCVRDWFLQDRLAPFRGALVSGSDRISRAMTYCDDPELRESWRKKNHRLKRGWTFNTV